MSIVNFKPQPKQEAFLRSPADIVIFGGAAGAGKSFALLLEPLRHVGNTHFGGVIFRREAKMITAEGGLRDTAMNIYPMCGASYRGQPRVHFNFPSGARISFEHLNMEEEVYNYQGAQIPFIGFDELTHFTRKQFIYLMSRNRSTCGVRPYIRATCNADADSWVAEMIEWWIDRQQKHADGSHNYNYGLPIPERSGVIRYFYMRDDRFRWGNSREDLISRGADADEIKSFTFIPALVWDNIALLEKDPGYIANLKAQSRVERARLLDGNWCIRHAGGSYFPARDVKILPAIPADVVKCIRSWDLAATELTETNDPDWTAGVKIAVQPNGIYVVTDVVHVRRRASDIRGIMRKVAELDGYNIPILLQQDPGQAGVDQIQSLVRHLTGFVVHSRRVYRDKQLRAEPLASQWQVGNVSVVRSNWTNEFLDEMERFPDGEHDDQVDAAIEAFHFLSRDTQAAAAQRKPTYASYERTYKN